MLDFDSSNDWDPLLAAALAEILPNGLADRVADAAPEFVEDALQLVFSIADRRKIIDKTLTWIAASDLFAYHGTRLTGEEVESLRVDGLIPLSADARRSRLVRALSRHSRWTDVADRLDEELLAHGPGQRAGDREGQVHLTLSRAALQEDFNHYLTHGSEFDQSVAHALLGAEGLALLQEDGRPRLLQVRVPGAIALAAAHPIFSIQDLLRHGDLPNVVREFLYVWSYRLFQPTYAASRLCVDCGLCFRSKIPGADVTQIWSL